MSGRILFILALLSLTACGGAPSRPYGAAITQGELTNLAGVTALILREMAPPATSTLALTLLAHNEPLAPRAAEVIRRTLARQGFGLYQGDVATAEPGEALRTVVELRSLDSEIVLVITLAGHQAATAVGRGDRAQVIRPVTMVEVRDG